MSEFFEMVENLRITDYVRSVSKCTEELYGFHAQKDYPDTTRRVTNVCYEEKDAPFIAAKLIATHHKEALRVHTTFNEDMFS